MHSAIIYNNRGIRFSCMHVSPLNVRDHTPVVRLDLISQYQDGICCLIKSVRVQRANQEASLVPLVDGAGS